MGEFSVKVTGEQVEVKLSKLRTPELIKAALHTLAQSEVAEQVPHQALPSAVLEFLDSSIQRLSDSLQAEIDALRATYCSEDEAEQALVDRREPLQVGQVKLVCEGRFWTLKAKGQPDGQFKGSLHLFAELMALVNKDVAVEESAYAWAYRPWLVVRPAEAWGDFDLAAGQPKLLRSSLEELGDLLGHTEAFQAPDPEQVPEWVKPRLLSVLQALEQLRKLLTGKGVEPKPVAQAQPANVSTAGDDSALIAIPGEMSPEDATALLNSGLKVSELLAFQQHLNQRSTELDLRSEEFETSMEERERDLRLRSEAVVKAEELALRA